MKYPQLHSLFYQNENEFIKEYEKRYSSISSEHLPFKIKDSDAFFIMLPNMFNSLEKIYDNNIKITKVFDKLPNVAKDSLINEFLIQELIDTNGIEGVHSTRREIQIAIDANANSEKVTEKKKKFQGLHMKYSAILSDGHPEIKTCKDIVDIYNTLVKPEIIEDNYPDGMYFRKGTVNVHSITDKIIHNGVFPEQKIIEYMSGLIDLINNHDTSAILKCAIVQYFIGYIHPFYDGNGRLGRFLGSFLLSGTLHKLIAIKLSYTIKGNLNKYYKAFTECNDNLNKGDITPFIIFTIEMITIASDDILQSLIEKVKQLDYYYKKIEKKMIELNLSEFHKNLLFIFVQNALFSSEKLDLGVLEKELSKSYNTIKNAIQNLISNNIPVITDPKEAKKGTKTLYWLNLEEFESHS